MMLSNYFKNVGVILAGRVLITTLAGVLLLGGCATSPAEKQSMVDSLLSQADDEVARGRRDQAIELLNRAAKESPASPAPWLKMANIRFDDGNYASAILAANEVLQREPANQEAKSLLVVAGLRVAAKNARGLASLNAVNSNARTEAENLTKTLKANLGEKSIIPAEGSRARKRSTHAKASAARAPVAAAAPAPAPAPAAASVGPQPIVHAAVQSATQAAVQTAVQAAPQAAANVAGDPFKSLK